ncbi:MAG: hypothetical protein AAGF92_09745 [Myxococcota bacterium]
MTQPTDHPPLPAIAVLFIWVCLVLGATAFVSWGLQGFPLDRVELLLFTATLWQGALLMWLAKGSTSLRDKMEGLPNARWKPLLYPILAMFALYFVLRHFVP